MPCCAVFGCTSSTHRTRKGKDVNHDVSFHQFPMDLQLRKIWIQKCKRQDSINPEFGCICSNHFLESDFCKYHQFRWSGSDGTRSKQKRRLQKGAIPSQNLPQTGFSK